MNLKNKERVLYGKLFCVYSRALMLLLIEKKLAFSFQSKMENYEDDSLPILVDRENIISGFFPIMEYLESKYLEYSFIKKNDEFETRRLLDWTNNHLYYQSGHNIMYERGYKHIWRLSFSKKPILQHSRDNLQKKLKYIDNLLSERKYISGDQLSAGDLFITAAISCLDYINEIKWSDYDYMYVWYLKMKSRPSFRSILNEKIVQIQPSPQYNKIDFDQH